MTQRTDGYSLNLLYPAAAVGFTATVPAAGLAAAIPANLLAYEQPCRLTAIQQPAPGILRLVVAGHSLRPAAQRHLTLAVGEILTLDWAIALADWDRTTDGMSVDFIIPAGIIPAGVPQVFNLRRTRPSYLLDACEDRIRTYRGYQLWRWTYGSRVDDLLDTLAVTDDVRQELLVTFGDISQAEVAELRVDEPIPFRYRARVRVAGGEEAEVGISS